MKSVILMVSLLALWPWSDKEYRLVASSSVPAATGTVKAKLDKDNGNINLEIRVEHLASPQSLTPPANNYIVWVRPRGADAMKQGAIGVDKNLRGELKTVTVAKDFDLLITAEQSEAVTVPSNVQVLSAHVTQE